LSTRWSYSLIWTRPGLLMAAGLGSRLSRCSGSPNTPALWGVLHSAVVPPQNYHSEQQHLRVFCAIKHFITACRNHLKIMLSLPASGLHILEIHFLFVWYFVWR
jgi:hypothetical protein